ncbi:hypothetical protein RHGRI_029557 [Rhododendron griersonianum]|uniref:CCHC-type domain-containing protein n=1 Tax=Rhododendron griersonianum TaxID=479676 RepID=A0AAV6IKF0_9ERIC|nr:hypothetical protein RHGRI_029557 [Rhododendron griersonianum]
MYDHLVTTLLYGKDEIRFNDVFSTLINNEVRKKDQQVHRDPSSSALSVRGRTESRNRQSGRRRSKSRGKSADKNQKSSDRKQIAKDECAYCHEMGHWKKDCPKIKEQQQQRASVARGEVDDMASALIVSSDTNSDEWILDSGCTYHMCPHWD